MSRNVRERAPQTQARPHPDESADGSVRARAGEHSFPTAPALYAHLLRAELRALIALQRVGVEFGERGADAPLGGPANHRRNPHLGHVAAERLVPGVFSPAPELANHVHRYLWALPRVEGRRVLEVGCGTGYGSLLLSWTASSVIAVDLDADAIAHARSHFPGIDFRVADAGDRLEQAVEVAVCFEVLEHVAEPEAVLRGIAQKSPRLLLSVPNPLASGSHLNPHHVNDWPLGRVRRRLREAGFTRQRVFHQSLRSPIVRRGGRRPWAVVWMIDAEVGGS